MHNMPLSKSKSRSMPKYKFLVNKYHKNNWFKITQRKKCTQLFLIYKPLRRLVANIKSKIPTELRPRSPGIQ